MSIEKLLIIAAGLCAAALAGAGAMPSAAPRPDKLDVADVINKTVCPIRLRVDTDEARIPRRIRVMECADDGTRWCARNNIPQHECCQHRHDNVLMQCVEVQDVVQVFYPATNDTQMMRVSVGCVCVMQKSTEAHESAPS